MIGMLFVSRSSDGQFVDALHSKTQTECQDRGHFLSNQTQKTWYSAQNGLSFECTSCGKCCHREGVVVFEREDVKRISAYLELTPEDFVFNYLHFDDGLWLVDVSDVQPCVFLDEHKHCTIHEVKPIQCSTYPFWPEVVESAAAWEEEAQFCEGINRGPTISLVEIASRLLDG